MPHGSGITLPPPWGAVSQAEALRLALATETGPLWLRVFLAALGRANTIGHAPFQPGELAQLLAQDGTPPHRTHLANAIRRGISAGLLHPDSGPRCLRPAPALWDRSGRTGARTCAWHQASAPAGRAPPCWVHRDSPAPARQHPKDTQ